MKIILCPFGGWVEEEIEPIEVEEAVMYSFKKVSHGGQGSGRVVVWGVLGWLCLLNVSVWGQFSDGAGTVGDPYLISAAGDMEALSSDPNHWDKHFKLTDDLDLTGTQFLVHS